MGTNFWEWTKTKPFLHLSLGKAVPFTLENNICVKALKRKVFQIIRCLIKPLLKNSTQTIFQGGTSWVAQLLNNIIVWMVLYCEHQLLGGKKKAKPFLHLSLGKAGPFTLESHICVKALKCKVFQIIGCLIKPLLNPFQTLIIQKLKVNWNQLKVNWSQLKPIESKLKVNSTELKVN